MANFPDTKDTLTPPWDQVGGPPSNKAYAVYGQQHTCNRGTSYSDNEWVEPNKYIERAVREAIVALVTPITGQTRDLTFLCDDSHQFEQVKSHLVKEFAKRGILAPGQILVLKNINNCGKITGVVATCLDKSYGDPARRRELDGIIRNAYACADVQNCGFAPASRPNPKADCNPDQKRAHNRFRQIEESLLSDWPRFADKAPPAGYRRDVLKNQRQRLHQLSP